MNTPEQKAQEEGYSFPYHYISGYENNNFTQFQNYKWGINYEATIQFLLSKISEETSNSIIDIGCGDGRLTKELYQKFGKTKNVVGLDYSDKAINWAKSLNPEITFYAKDIVQETINEKFEAGVLMEVFEHIPPISANAFVNAIAGLIKNGGHLYLTVPHINYPLTVHHFRHFSIKTLTEAFEDKFDILEIIPFEKIDKRKRILDTILTNKYFILNHTGFLNKIFKYYQKKLFFVKNENSCKRLFLKARRK